MEEEHVYVEPNVDFFNKYNKIFPITFAAIIRNKLKDNPNKAFGEPEKIVVAIPEFVMCVPKSCLDIFKDLIEVECNCL